MTNLRKSLGGGAKSLGFTLAEVPMAKRTSGIENEVLYSRESEPKEPSNKIKKLAAFTLAEVLITLAIIGVVAALTIPVLVQKYQNKMFYSQFMKTYNTLSTAIQLAQAEHGGTISWGTTYEKSSSENTDIYKEKLMPYLRIQQYCAGANDCGITNDLKVSTMNGMQESYSNLGFGGYGITPFILQDGSIVSIGMDSGYISYALRLDQIAVDTNGIKGPNVIGRDILFIQFDYKDGMTVPHQDDRTPEQLNQACLSPSDYDDFSACTTKLITEGKMDY